MGDKVGQRRFHDGDEVIAITDLAGPHGIVQGEVLDASVSPEQRRYYVKIANQELPQIVAEDALRLVKQQG